MDVRAGLFRARLGMDAALKFVGERGLRRFAAVPLFLSHTQVVGGLRLADELVHAEDERLDRGSYLGRAEHVAAVDVTAHQVVGGVGLGADFARGGQLAFHAEGHAFRLQVLVLLVHRFQSGYRGRQAQFLHVGLRLRFVQILQESDDVQRFGIVGLTLQASVGVDGVADAFGGLSGLVIDAVEPFVAHRVEEVAQQFVALPVLFQHSFGEDARLRLSVDGDFGVDVLAPFFQQRIAEMQGGKLFARDEGVHAVVELCVQRIGVPAAIASVNFQ